MNNTGENTGISDDAEDEPMAFDEAVQGVKDSIARFKDFLSKPIE